MLRVLSSIGDIFPELYELLQRPECSIIPWLGRRLNTEGSASALCLFLECMIMIMMIMIMMVITTTIIIIVRNNSNDDHSNIR